MVRRRLSWPILKVWLWRGGVSLTKQIGLVVEGQFSPRASTLYRRWVTRNPETYVEKIRYKMAHDRRPILTLFADKLAVRGYVRHHIGDNHLSEVFSVAETYSELNWDRVPEEFVLKVNHACRGLVVVTKNADPYSSLPQPDTSKPWRLLVVHPRALNKESMGGWVSLWLRTSYNWQKWEYREWAYADVKRRVFVEEFLGGERILCRNVKVVCFHGRAVSIIVTKIALSGKEEAEGRFSSAELEGAAELAAVPVPRLRTLVTDSELLSKETDFLRVDWILTPRGPVFGELTSYPAAGTMPAGPSLNMSAKEVNRLYSKLWQVPRRYSDLPQGRYPTED